jgi:hypothetical protein
VPPYSPTFLFVIIFHLFHIPSISFVSLLMKASRIFSILSSVYPI